MLIKNFVCIISGRYFFLDGRYRPSLEKGSDQLNDTIYLSLCTQSADPKHFRGTACNSETISTAAFSKV